MKKKHNAALFNDAPESVRALRWMFDPVFRVSSILDNFDPREPRTTQQRMQASVEGQLQKEFDKRTPEEVATSFFDALSDDKLRESARLGMNEVARNLKSAASKDQRYSLLLGLIAEVEKRAMFATTAVVGLIDWPAHFLRECEPMDALGESHTLEGERRARAVRRALREVAEMVYEPYLRVLCALGHYAKGEPSPQLREFGNLVSHAAALLPADRYPGLVDADASFLRNAASHGHWSYDSHDDTLTLWDRNREAETFTVDELRDRALSMFTVAGSTLRNVAQLYLIRNVYREGGLLELVMDPRLCSADADARDLAGDELAQQLDLFFEPARTFLQSVHAATPPVAPPACAFCGRPHGQVQVLVPNAGNAVSNGPSVHICNICVERFSGLIGNSSGEPMYEQLHNTAEVEVDGELFRWSAVRVAVSMGGEGAATTTQPMVMILVRRLGRPAIASLFQLGTRPTQELAEQVARQFRSHL